MDTFPLQALGLTQLGILVTLAALLWWRMRVAESAIAKLVEKLEHLSPERIASLESEMMRVRDALHDMRGQLQSLYARLDMVERRRGERRNDT